MTKILVTGGAGYIGSHTCVSLIEAGYDVVVVDDFSNSQKEVLSRVEKLVGKKIPFYEGDIQKREVLNPIFKEHDISCVIHFAGKKAVGESVRLPLSYYRTNIMGTLTLCESMQANNVKNLVFSSSATVYGNTEKIPLTEDSPLGTCSNPYGWTKWMIEQILRDFLVADPAWSVHLLRYFNPVGAHISGEIGEDPKGIPNNIMPFLTQVAIGRHEAFQVFGNDYPTPDGTCIRDYVHVVDLAQGHVASVKACLSGTGISVFNLGSGKGYSVMEMLHAFGKAVGKEIPYTITGRRAGDVAVSYASAEKAKRELGWQTMQTLDTMCADSWRWQTQNPDGYK